VVQASQSAIEYEPADFVAQLLIVKHKITDFARKLCALPCALKATSFFSLTVKRRLACGFDRVGGCPQFMGCHMSDHPCLTSRICGMARRSAQTPSCRHRVTTRRSGLGHRNLTLRPSARRFDGLTRTFVIGLHFLKQVQHMLCAIGCPYRKQVMIGVLKGAAATHSDEPGVSLLW
jgi:hypothetical protein